MKDHFKVEVSDVRAEARDVLLVELKAVNGQPLPPFEPGAHLEITLPGGLIRHYSLASDFREKDHYTVGVGRAQESRGGSDYVHSRLRTGDRLDVKGPLNNFPLDSSAPSYFFIAGGIGITPIMAMIRWCVANDKNWHMVYASRSRQRAAFYEELQELGGNRVRFHFDDEAEGFVDVGAIVENLAAEEQIYCCGPTALMKAVEAATDYLPGELVHFEYFKAPEKDPVGEVAGDAFTVVLKRSNQTLTIPPEKSILEVLEQNDIAHPFSCREGLCGTCETAVLEGTPDHQDYVLSHDEQQAGDRMMICVSRAKSDRLVLDL